MRTLPATEKRAPLVLVVVAVGGHWGAQAEPLFVLQEVGIYAMMDGQQGLLLVKQMSALLQMKGF